MSHKSRPAPQPLLQRCFARVGRRHVHFWTGGAGGPIALIHGSPASAQLLLPLARALAEYFQVFAFDTPGFGDSDPLPSEELSLGDLATAYVEVFDVLGFGRLPVFGTHTGASIALELALHHPDRVTGLLLDGLAIFTSEEQAVLLGAEYMPALELDTLGSQYSKTWTRFRDQYVWFPWFRRSPEQLLETDLGDAEAVHMWVQMYFRAAAHYRPAYRAAISYGAAGLEAVRGLQTPAIFCAERADMLFPHLARLPPLRPEQQIVELAAGTSAKVDLIRRFAATLPSSVLRKPTAQDMRDGWQRDFVRAGAGQLFFRHAGPRDAPAVLLIHDAPGAGGPLLALADELAVNHRVLLPDLPGCGESDLPADSNPALGDYAHALSGFLQSVLPRVSVDVYGIGCGAAVALELAHRSPEQIRRVAVTGLLRTQGADRAALRGRLAPPITLSPDGGHWYRTWLMLRDSLVWWPWYEQRRTRLRRQPIPISAHHLHESTLEVMRHWHSYHKLVEAMLDWTAPADSTEVLLCVDPLHPLADSDRDWIARTPDLRNVCLPANRAAAARVLAAALGE